MSELIFQVDEDILGGYTADCLTEAISTHAPTWEQLRHNVQKAVATFYLDGVQRPERVRLRLVRDEVLVQPSSMRGI
jgi:hypothetical protein